MALVGCVCFGYAALSCLVFRGAMRKRASQYTKPSLKGLVQSPYYNWTIWATGIIGLAGFLISSWEVVLNLLALLRTS